MKSLLKILYVGFAFILAIFIYILGYNSNGYSHIQTLTSNAISEKNYVEVAKIHGGCFYSESLVTDNNDKFDLQIFPSATLSTYTYYKTNDADAETTAYNIYEISYYIYIITPTYEFDDLSSEKVFNNTAIKFNSENGSYNYLLNVNDTINTDLYAAKPLSVNEAALKSSRSASSNYSNWGFFNITLTKTMVDEMQSELNGDITSITVVDSYGNDVDTIDVTLNFEHQFFTDVEPLATEYNTFIKDYNAADNSEDKQKAEDKFNAFYEGTEGSKGYKDTFHELNEKNTLRHDDSYLRPTKLIWQSIGMIVLFLICAALIYILLFHFNLIKAIVFKDRSGNYRKASGSYNKSNAINAKVQTVNNKSNTNTKTTKADNKIVEKSVVEEKQVKEEIIEKPVVEEKQTVEEIVESVNVEAVEEASNLENKTEEK